MLIAKSPRIDRPAGSRVYAKQTTGSSPVPDACPKECGNHDAHRGASLDNQKPGSPHRLASARTALSIEWEAVWRFRGHLSVRQGLRAVISSRISNWGSIWPAPVHHRCFAQKRSSPASFPASRDGIRSQRSRWEHGYLSVILSDARSLLLESLTTRNPDSMAWPWI